VSLYGRAFVLVCASTFLFYVSFQLILPVVPLYAAELGGRETQVGLIIGVFAFTSMFIRPLAGWLADRVGRRPLVRLGSAVFAVASLAYPAVGGIGTLLLLRVFHGTGMGVGPTAATVVVTDVSPPERRGEAMGVFGLTMTAGTVFAPFLGVELLRRAGFAWTFFVSAALGALALAVAWALPETRPTAAASMARLSLTPRALFSRRALYPCVMVVALHFTMGAVFSFVPLFATRADLGNPGLFFTVFALAAVVVRGAAGRLADDLGRRLVAVPSLALAGLGLAGLARADSLAWLLAAAVLYGVGLGAGQPALMAMTTDRVRAEERGRAMGTFYTAWELGIASGSVLLGACAARWGFPAMWWAAAAVAWAGACAGARDITRPRG
jgi:MFS family permease